MNQACLLALCLVFATLNIAKAQSVWEKKRDSDGIVVYTRQVEGAKIREVRAETTMPGNLEQYQHLLSQIDEYHNWLPNCSESAVLKTVSPDEIIYYVVLNMPFPFTDRDMIQHIMFQNKEDSLIVSIANEPDFEPQKDDLVRMATARGFWRVKQITPDRISVVFQYFADPSGELPAWLINSFIAENPYKTIYNIREIMRDKNS